MAVDDGPRQLLVGGTVVTMDEERRVLDPGAVSVSGDRIVEVGPRDELVESFPGAERTDLEGSILLPGLVDSHGHAGHGMTKNLADGTGEWMDVVEEVYFRASDEGFWRAEGYLAALERLGFGVTTSLSFTGSMPRVDDPRYATAAAEGYADLGLRHVVAVGPPNPPFPRVCRDPDTGEEIPVDLDRAMATTEAVVDGLHGSADGRLSVFVAPSALVPEVVTDEGRAITGLAASRELGTEQVGGASERSMDQLRRVLSLAEDRDVGIQAHAYRGQVRAAAESVPEVLSPRLSLAHGAGVSDEEVEILAETGVGVSHGPLTHAYAIARFPVVEALEAGATVAISTDGSSPDRSFDLLSMGRIAAQLQRVHANDDRVLPAGKVLEMMTIDAARLLGMEAEVGSLEPGKKADVIAVDTASAHLRPRYLPVERLVHYASGHDVSFVMVDGSVLMEDRSLDGVDVSGILAEADRAAAETLERADATEHLRSHPNTWGHAHY